MAVPKKIAFYAGGCIPIHANTLNERPLGGTETGLIRLAEILQKRGHLVTVFTSHKSPAESLPRYVPASQIYNHGRFDLLVTVQEWRPVFFNLPANRIWFWTGDGYEQFSNYGLGDLRTIDKIERFLAVSNYHADSLSRESGFPREKTSIIGNGVHLEYFAGTEPRHHKRLIFTSAPYRGLQFVAPLFVALKKRHPDLEFHAFTGMSLYDREQPFEGPHVAQFRKVAAQLETIPGCFLHGNVTQAQLSREYMKSSIFFYPANVPETCCIAILEAQAAGCAIVTSNIGALRESTADTGVSIDGAAGSPEFMQNFMAATDQILSDEQLFKKFSEAGKTRAAAELSWERVADRFEQLI